MAPFKSPYPPVSFPDESYATFLLRDTYSPDTAAYIDGITGESVTRKEQKARVMSLARGLRNVERVGLLPLHKGTNVVVYSPNSLLYPVVMIAMVRAKNKHWPSYPLIVCVHEHRASLAFARHSRTLTIWFRSSFTRSR